MKGELVMRDIQEANVPGMSQSVSALTHVNNSTELEYVTGGFNWRCAVFCAALGFSGGGPVGAVVGGIAGGIFG
jgi:hypothetical protein